MSANVTRGIETSESSDDHLNDVEKRARWESFSFVIPCKGKVNVANHSHGENEVAEHTYTVTVEDGEATDCTCPAAEYHGFPCKHALAVEQNEAVLMAASGRVATDGGQVLDDDVIDLAEEYGCAPVDEDLPAITEHVEPEAQGGATYIRCERCETEVIGTDPDRLVHREGCPHVDPGDFTL